MTLTSLTAYDPKRDKLHPRELYALINVFFGGSKLLLIEHVLAHEFEEDVLECN